MHFNPPFPSQVYQCCWCGKKLNEDKYLTVQVRSDSWPGEYRDVSFCGAHGARYQDFVDAWNRWRAERYAQLEAQLRAEEPEAAARIEREVMGTGPVVERDVVAAERPGTPLTLNSHRLTQPGEIPNPMRQDAPQQRH